VCQHTQDDDDEGEGEEEHTRWWARPRVWFRIAAFTLSALLLVVGILTHNVEAMKKVNNSGVQLFRCAPVGVCKHVCSLLADTAARDKLLPVCTL
jgi:hypothetical protein